MNTVPGPHRKDFTKVKNKLVNKSSAPTDTGPGPDLAHKSCFCQDGPLKLLPDPIAWPLVWPARTCSLCLPCPLSGAPVACVPGPQHVSSTSGSLILEVLQGWNPSEIISCQMSHPQPPKLTFWTLGWLVSNSVVPTSIHMALSPWSSVSTFSCLDLGPGDAEVNGRTPSPTTEQNPGQQTRATSITPKVGKDL